MVFLYKGLRAPGNPTRLRISSATYSRQGREHLSPPRHRVRSRFLIEQVPEELHPLYINLLGSGPEEGKSLESSVGEILRKNEDWNEDQAESEIKTLANKLQELRKEKAKVDRRLRDIRESETHSQSVAEGTYRGTAAQIAKSVNQNRSNYDWFTDTALLHKKCPITADELRNLLKKLRHFSPEKQQELEPYMA